MKRFFVLILMTALFGCTPRGPLAHPCKSSPESVATVYVVTPHGFSINLPHRNYSNFYKGATHVHTSEGFYTHPDKNVGTIADVTLLYTTLGYTFVAITNHDEVYDSNDTNLTGCNFEGCILRFGVDCDCECKAQICLWGQEATVKYSSDAWHQGEYWRGSCATGMHVKNHPYDKEIGNLSHLEDPTPGWGYYKGMEISSTKKYTLFWDWALSVHSNDGHLPWGFASDDCHTCVNSDINRGWIVVNSNSTIPNYDDIMYNVKRGNFFAVSRSVGVEAAHPGSPYYGPIPEITLVGSVLNVALPSTCSKVSFIGVDGEGTPGSLLGSAYNTNAATYSITGTEKYVRVEIEQTVEGDTYIVYSQPMQVLVN